MKILLKSLKEIAYGLVFFIAAIIIGGMLYLAIGDLTSAPMDRSRDAQNGAAVIFALPALLAYIVWRVVRRRKNVVS